MYFLIKKLLARLWHTSFAMRLPKTVDIFSNLCLRSFCPGSFWWKRAGFMKYQLTSAQPCLTGSSPCRAEQEGHARGADTSCCSWALKEEWIRQHLPFITEEHSDVREIKWGWSPHPFFSFTTVCAYREKAAFTVVPLLCVCAKARKIACSVIVDLSSSPPAFKHRISTS